MTDPGATPAPAWVEQLMPMLEQAIAGFEEGEARALGIWRLGPCRFELIATLFGRGERARFRYVADFGGAVSAEVLGDKCQLLALSFDASEQVFRPAWRRGGHCRN